jgi:hypothetical protein
LQQMQPGLVKSPRSFETSSGSCFVCHERVEAHAASRSASALENATSEKSEDCLQKENIQGASAHIREACPYTIGPATNIKSKTLGKTGHILRLPSSETIYHYSRHIAKLPHFPLPTAKNLFLTIHIPPHFSSSCTSSLSSPSSPLSIMPPLKWQHHNPSTPTRHSTHCVHAL